MKSFRTTLSFSLVALVAVLAGCAAEAGNVDTETAQSEQAVTSPAGNVAATDLAAKEGHGPRFGHGGPEDHLLVAALHEDIGLTDAQKATLTALLPQRDANGTRPDPAKRGAELAAAIRSGNVASLAEPAKPTDAEQAAHKAEMVKKLQTLHDTLTATQRQALVAAVQKHEERGPKDHGPKGDHKDHVGGPMGGMLQGIDLTDAQKAQIETKLAATRPAKPTDAQIAEREAKHAAMKAERTAKLQTFASDSFDANAFATPPAKSEGEATKPHGPGADLAVIVSVLDANQREQLAKKIEQGPPAR